MARESGWSRKFEDPIIIAARGPRGKERQLVTLKDAGEYIAKLPKAEHTATEWQTRNGSAAARRCSRIGIMKALNRHEVHPPGVHGQAGGLARAETCAAQMQAIKSKSLRIR